MRVQLKTSDNVKTNRQQTRQSTPPQPIRTQALTAEHPLLRMQRLYGNRYVQQMIRVESAVGQPKGKCQSEFLIQSRPATPELEDCRETMRKNLPRAHRRTIDLLTRAIKFYQAAFSLVFKEGARGTTARHLYSKLGRNVANHLAIYWRINVIPALRKKRGLSDALTSFQVLLEILAPLAKIIKVYSKTKAGLEEADFNYECEYKDRWWYQGCDEDTVAWVYASGLGDIHICVDDLNDPDDIDAIALSIIHEATHKFAKTTDEGLLDNAHQYEQAISGLP